MNDEDKSMILKENVCDEHDFRYKDVVSIGSFEKCVTNFTRSICLNCGTLEFEIKVYDGMTKGIRQVGKVVLTKYMLEENGNMRKIDVNAKRIQLSSTASNEYNYMKVKHI